MCGHEQRLRVRHRPSLRVLIRGVPRGDALEELRGGRELPPTATIPPPVTDTEEDTDDDAAGEDDKDDEDEAEPTVGRGEGRV